MAFLRLSSEFLRARATFFEELVGENLGLTHYIPIAVVIIVFMLLKQRLEHTIGAIFEKKKIDSRF
jgi:hypothetical protein